MHAADKFILINVEATQISVAEMRQGLLFDFEVERSNRLVGNVYLGRIETILPGMDAAFVNIGLNRHALIYAGDLGVSGADGVSPLPIEKVLRPGDTVVVQVARAPVGSKGARVSGRLSLLGRHVLLSSHAENVGVSRRIENAGERERLRRIAERLRPLDYSLIVRTEASGASEQELAQDIALLMQRFGRIAERARQLAVPSLLYRETGVLGRLVRDRLNERASRIIIDNEIEYSMLRETVGTSLPHLVERIFLHDAPEPLFKFYGVQEAIDATGERIVALPKGGTLAIDEAEALTAIDVNTGRFVGKSRLADTVLQTNLEAAQETARQLRLRNIGGVIVIDFIDMERTRDRVKVMDALEKALKEDHTRTRIVQLSPLGLVEMTRRRQGESLRQLTTCECPYCEGEGRIQTPYSVALTALQEVRSLCAARHKKGEHSSKKIVMSITLHPLAAIELLGEDAETIQALEKTTESTIYLNANPSIHQEVHYIEIGQASDFNAIETRFTVGARFEISPTAFVNEDSSFVVAHRALIHIEELSSEKSGPARKALWAEVTAVHRWFVEARILVRGEPSQ